MKQPTFNGKELLPLSVMEAAHAGDAMAMERVLRYYEGYINKLCTRTLYDSNGFPYVCDGTAPETEMSLFFLSMFPLTRWPLGVP